MQLFIDQYQPIRVKMQNGENYYIVRRNPSHLINSDGETIKFTSKEDAINHIQQITQYLD